MAPAGGAECRILVWVLPVATSLVFVPSWDWTVQVAPLTVYSVIVPTLLTIGWLRTMRVMRLTISGHWAAYAVAGVLGLAAWILLSCIFLFIVLVEFRLID